MLSPQEVMEKYPEEVNEFFKVLFALSDEQTAAMDKVIPMTQELFESCFEKLMSVDAIRSCMKLIDFIFIHSRIPFCKMYQNKRSFL